MVQTILSPRTAATPDPQIIHASPADPQARPLIDDLIREYSTRYQDLHGPEAAAQELARYPAEAFAPPHGAFILLIADEATIGGGAFMRYDDDTAEFKRIWTDTRYRRQGLARRVVLALEAEAVRLGYSRVYLTTGFRQPEAVGLYLSLGYTALFDTGADPETLLKLPFEKALSPATANEA